MSSMSRPQDPAQPAHLRFIPPEVLAWISQQNGIVLALAAPAVGDAELICARTAMHGSSDCVHAALRAIIRDLPTPGLEAVLVELELRAARDELPKQPVKVLDFPAGEATH